MVKNAILGYCGSNGVKFIGTSSKSVPKTIAIVSKPKIKHIEIRVPKPYFEKHQNCIKFLLLMSVYKNHNYLKTDRNLMIFVSKEI